MLMSLEVGTRQLNGALQALSVPCDRTMPLNCPDLVSEGSGADVAPGEDGLKVEVAPCRSEGSAPHTTMDELAVSGVGPFILCDSPVSRSTEGAGVYGANFRHRSIFVRKFQDGIPHFVPNPRQFASSCLFPVVK